MAPLRHSSLDAFLVDPVGRYFSGPTYLGWALGPSFSGGAAWGRPSLDDGAAMIRGHAWHDSAGLRPPVDVLLDLSGLESISVPLFALYVREMAPRVSFFARLIRRQALIVPAGLVGTIVAGFYPMLEGRTPRYRVFREPSAAFDWLGQGSAQVEIDRVVHVQRTRPQMVCALRELLVASHCAIGLEEAAAGLSVSSRSLQRSLADAHTSFRVEQQRARLQLAYEALGSGEAKLDAVAEQVGLANASHFCAWFRETTGLTPAQWRSSPQRPE